jgi:hypothetical protein
MTRRARLTLAGAAAAAALGALLLVFAAYQDPHLMVQLSNAFWSCF